MTTFTAIGVSCAPSAAHLADITEAVRADAAKSHGKAPGAAAAARATARTYTAVVDFMETCPDPRPMKNNQPWPPIERLLARERFDIKSRADLDKQVAAVLTRLKERHDEACAQLSLDITGRTLGTMQGA